MTADSVGARLREARTEKRLSLRSVAAALGVSASLISQVETGKTQPSVATLYALATHLGLSLDDLDCMRRYRAEQIALAPDERALLQLVPNLDKNVPRGHNGLETIQN